MATVEEIRAQRLFPEYGITEKETDTFEHFSGDERPAGEVFPEGAQTELEKLGYDPTTWKRIVAEKIGSHYVRTFAIIALGETPGLGFVINANLRAIDHLEGDRLLDNDMGVGPTLRDTTMHTEALKDVMQKTQSFSL